MSDQATVTAPTPESTNVQAAPAEVQATNTQPTPQAEGQVAQRLDRKSAFRAMQDRLAPKAAETPTTETPAPVAAPAPVVDSQGRVHDPATGKFIEKDPATPATAPVAEVPQTAPATASVPEGYVRIELPEDHPLRARGRDHLIAPADLERDYRSLVNSPLKAREAEAELARTRENLVRLQAESEVRSKMFTAPEFQAAQEQIRVLKEQGFAELAAIAEMGLEQKIQSQTQERVGELGRVQWNAQVVEAGNRTQADAEALISKRYPMEWLMTPGGQEVVRKAINTYVGELRDSLVPGEAPRFDPTRIVELADIYAIRDPWMRQHLTGQLQAQRQAEQESERQRIANEVDAQRKAEEAERLQLAGQKRATFHPMGIPSQVRTDRQSVSTEGPNVLDVPPHQRRNAARERAMSRTG
jgi:hypothetical protein